jgi:hypothetical protein
MAASKLSAVLSSSARECWLALTEDESAIAGRGDTPVEAAEEAQRAGVQDPILVWAPKNWSPSVFR